MLARQAPRLLAGDPRKQLPALATRGSGVAAPLGQALLDAGTTPLVRGTSDKSGRPRLRHADGASPPLTDVRGWFVNKRARDGIERQEGFDAAKIAARVRAMADGLEVDAEALSREVETACVNGMQTSAIDMVLVCTAARKVPLGDDYGVLAGRIRLGDLMKKMRGYHVFSTNARFLAEARDPFTGAPRPLLRPDIMAFVEEHAIALDRAVAEAIAAGRDMGRTIFGMETLLRGYLLSVPTHQGRLGDKDDPSRIVRLPHELPQQMYMRVAIESAMADGLAAVLQSFDDMSAGRYTHGSPGMFNSGTDMPQMSSCFLTPHHGDSMEDIWETFKVCSSISKMAGGIGLPVGCVRAEGAYIAGARGVSGGLPSMLPVLRAEQRYVNQGSHRKGAISAWLPMWHADVCKVLENSRPSTEPAKNLFELNCGLWVPDLFMHRAQRGGKWTFFSPDSAPRLCTLSGEAFEELYLRTEAAVERGEVLGRQVEATAVLQWMYQAQLMTGRPYVMFSDACNRKSLQQNLGTIQNSNLCCEIVQYSHAAKPSDPVGTRDETAVCTLASIAVPRFVRPGALARVPHASSDVYGLAWDDASSETEADIEERLYGLVDFGELARVVRRVTRNLNHVLDRNRYPTPCSEYGGKSQRAIGIGIQGLNDAYMLLGAPFDSRPARVLNRMLAAHLYYYAIEESAAMAVEAGRPCEAFLRNGGSPAAAGKLQPDLWGKAPMACRGMDWDALRKKAAAGLYNSQVTAYMPTASTAQILGNNEAFEACARNLYERVVLSGSYLVINPHLVRALRTAGAWTPDVQRQLVEHGGSVQRLEGVPKEIKLLFRTADEIGVPEIIRQAADRGPYVSGSQSMNWYVGNNLSKKDFVLYLFMAWAAGLKTGIYYLRQRERTSEVVMRESQKVIEESQGVAGTDSGSSTSCSSSFSSSEEEGGGEGEEEGRGGIVAVGPMRIGLPMGSMSAVRSTRVAPAVCAPGCDACSS